MSFDGPDGPRQVVVQPGHSILSAARDAGLDLPFSCTVGGCGACRQRLVEGRVWLPAEVCLTPQERADGYVLLCVGRPLSAVRLELR